MTMDPRPRNLNTGLTAMERRILLSRRRRVRPQGAGVPTYIATHLSWALGMLVHSFTVATDTFLIDHVRDVDPSTVTDISNSLRFRMSSNLLLGYLGALNRLM